MAIPELPDDLVVKVFISTPMSLHDLYWCRQVCSAWRQSAARAKNLQRALVPGVSAGGKVGKAKKFHPLVRGKEMFHGPDQICAFGDGFLCVPELGRHEVRIAKINADGGLSVYDELWPWMNPNFAQPRAALHARTAEGFEVLYLVTNGEVRRFFTAEFETGQTSTPAARSAAAIGTSVGRLGGWFDGTFGELFYGYARRPPADFNAPTFFKSAPSLDPPNAGPNQSSGLSYPQNLALDAEANELYVCDTHCNRLSAVEVLDAGTLKRKRSFKIQTDASGIANRSSPNAIVIWANELYISTLSFVHVYSKSGEFLRIFSDSEAGGQAKFCLSPVETSKSVRPRGMAVYPINGVDHMLVASAKHVHVLSLPDGLPRQIVEVPGANYLHQLCVHHGRAYVSDTNGNRIHVLEPCAGSESAV